MKYEYGKDRNGKVIIPPKDWKILPEGIRVPNVHREFIHSYDIFSYEWMNDGHWADPRRCISTMTPIHAQVWGHVFAFAVPEII